MLKQSRNIRIDRRRFIASSAGVAAGLTIVKPSAVKGFAANSRIEVGFVGLGGRGGLIAGMLANHAGYQIVSIGDYFDHVVRGQGERLKVAADRCFSGLSGYKKVIASKVDAMFLETPP